MSSLRIPVEKQVRPMVFDACSDTPWFVAIPTSTPHVFRCERYVVPGEEKTVATKSMRGVRVEGPRPVTMKWRKDAAGKWVQVPQHGVKLCPPNAVDVVAPGRDEGEPCDLSEYEIGSEQLGPVAETQADLVTDPRHNETTAQEISQRARSSEVRIIREGQPKREIRVRVSHPSQCPRNWAALPAFIDADQFDYAGLRSIAVVGKVLVTRQTPGSYVHRFASAVNSGTLDE